MGMKTIVFEDRAVGQLGLLTAARPACDLTIGCSTLVEALGHFGPVRRAVRPHLARYLEAVAGSRCSNERMPAAAVALPLLRT